MGGMEKANQFLEAIPILGHYLRSLPGELQERDLPARQERAETLAQFDMLERIMQEGTKQDALRQKKRQHEETIETKKSEGEKDRVQERNIATEKLESGEEQKALDREARQEGDRMRHEAALKRVEQSKRIEVGKILADLRKAKGSVDKQSLLQQLDNLDYDTTALREAEARGTLDRVMDSIEYTFSGTPAEKTGSGAGKVSDPAGILGD